MDTNPILALLGSKKALIMLVAVVGAIVLAAIGKVDGQQALDFCKWVVMTWLGAQAVVDAAPKLRFLHPPTTVVNNLSTAKPAKADEDHVP